MSAMNLGDIENIDIGNLVFSESDFDSDSVSLNEASGFLLAAWSWISSISLGVPKASMAMPFAILDPMGIIGAIQTKRAFESGLAQANQSKLHPVEKKTWVFVRTACALTGLMPNWLMESWNVKQNIMRFLGGAAAVSTVGIAMSFAFSFTNAMECLHDLQYAARAKDKIDPEYLCRDRLEKLKILNQDSRFADPKYNQAKTRIKNQISALHAKVPGAHSLYEEAHKETYEALSDYLIQKQKNKYNHLRFSAFSAACLSLGTLCGGLAALTASCPPLAMAFGIVAAVCGVIRGSIALHSIYQNRKTQKSVQKEIVKVANDLINKGDQKVVGLRTEISKVQGEIKINKSSSWFGRRLRKAKEKILQAKLAGLNQDLKSHVSLAIVRHELKLEPDQDPLDFVSKKDIQKIVETVALRGPEKTQARERVVSVADSERSRASIVVHPAEAHPIADAVMVVRQAVPQPPQPQERAPNDPNGQPIIPNDQLNVQIMIQRQQEQAQALVRNQNARNRPNAPNPPRNAQHDPNDPNGPGM